MIHDNYRKRALSAKDSRYARIFDALGYGRKDMRAEQVVESITDDVSDELSDLRSEYKELYGKKAYAGWDADKLRAKIEYYQVEYYAPKFQAPEYVVTEDAEQDAEE